MTNISIASANNGDRQAKLNKAKQTDSAPGSKRSRDETPIDVYRDSEFSLGISEFCVPQTDIVESDISTIAYGEVASMNEEDANATTSSLHQLTARLHHVPRGMNRESLSRNSATVMELPNSSQMYESLSSYLIPPPSVEKDSKPDWFVKTQERQNLDRSQSLLQSSAVNHFPETLSSQDKIFSHDNRQLASGADVIFDVKKTKHVNETTVPPIAHQQSTLEMFDSHLFNIEALVGGSATEPKLEVNSTSANF
jgi:hypothetical protein